MNLTSVRLAGDMGIHVAVCLYGLGLFVNGEKRIECLFSEFTWIVKTLIPIQGIDLGHIVAGQLEIKDGSVLDQSLSF